MSRELPAWATPTSTRRRPRVTWFGDVARFARTGFGTRHRRPAGAPEREPRPRQRLGASDFLRRPTMLALLPWRLDYQVAGLDALRGIQGPVLFAVNEAGALDWQVLSPVLPPRLRTTARASSRALARGRSVVVFTEDPVVDGEVGEFSILAVQLAHQHNLPIVPVALVGTFKLKEVLRLPVWTRPRVSIRFGAPIYVRGRSVAEATDEVQATVEQLFSAGDLSWWATQRPTTRPAEVPTGRPRWRRLWEQTGERPAPQRRRIWR